MEKLLDNRHTWVKTKENTLKLTFSFFTNLINFLTRKSCFLAHNFRHQRQKKIDRAQTEKTNFFFRKNKKNLKVFYPFLFARNTGHKNYVFFPQVFFSYTKWKKIRQKKVSFLLSRKTVFFVLRYLLENDGTQNCLHAHKRAFENCFFRNCDNYF